MIRRCLGVGDLYSTSPLLGPTGRHALSPDHPNTAYIVKHQFVSYNISTLVTCVRFYGGARRGLCGVDDASRPRHPKLRATLATSPRRHSLIRDWNICKYSRDLHHLGCGDTEEMKTKRMTGPLLHSPLSLKIQDVLQFSESLDPVFKLFKIFGSTSRYALSHIRRV